MSNTQTFKQPKFITKFFAALGFFTALYSVLFAATPNPGHPWSEVGDGIIGFYSTNTIIQTFTLPAVGSSILTSYGMSTGSLIYGTSNASTSILPMSTSSLMYLSNSTSTGLPLWSQVNLRFGATDTLPVSSGGTGSTTFPAKSLLIASGTNEFTALPSPSTQGIVTSSSTGYYIATTTRSDMFLAFGFAAANITTTLAPTSGTAYAQFMGTASKDYNSCTVIQRVQTALSANTWAEIAIFRGPSTYTAGGPNNLTRLGFTNVAATYTPVGVKNTNVSASIKQGDPLWVVSGFSGGTMPVLRAGIAENISTGAYATAVVRPSLATSPQAFTANSVSAQLWTALHCQ